jgi:hypothetical protein
MAFMGVVILSSQLSCGVRAVLLLMPGHTFLFLDLRGSGNWPAYRLTKATHHIHAFLSLFTCPA